MFTADLYVTALDGKEPKLPSAGEQISKLCHLCITEHCPATKRNKVLMCAPGGQGGGGGSPRHLAG